MPTSITCLTWLALGWEITKFFQEWIQDILPGEVVTIWVTNMRTIDYTFAEKLKFSYGGARLKFPMHAEADIVA